jgi:hypothetical protein
MWRPVSVWEREAYPWRLVHRKDDEMQQKVCQKRGTEGGRIRRTDHHVCLDDRAAKAKLNQ